MKNEKPAHVFRDVEDYIASQPQSIRATLEKLRSTIKKAVPQAEEVFSYQMPAYRYHGMLIYFASFTKHYSVFMRPGYLDHFRTELKDYSMTKSAVHFPLDKQFPVQLLTKMVKFAARQNLENSTLKLNKKLALRKKALKNKTQ